ncbi:MAG TPA: metallophosphoesterase family protein [Steroidobacteraceae bacterium]|nr:metallophosphoesterase family protein [Steroidobacteraceae bacterium]
MRIALVSDIHGNLPALEAVLDDTRRRGVTRIVNLGDSLSGPLLPLETARFLMKQDWVQLAGNHERQLLEFAQKGGGESDTFAHALLTPEVFAWMRSLTHSRALDDEVFLCHGTPRSDVEGFLDSVEGEHTRPATADEIAGRCTLAGPRVIACGHTHIARVLQSATGQLLVNPGSVGLQAYDDTLLDRSGPHYYRVENGDAYARYATIEKRGGAWHAQVHPVPYDQESMALLAERNGRPDWAHALRTGMMPRQKEMQ